jgi:hypothetical protein
MGIFSAARKRRVALTSRESVATLTSMQDFFGNGANWTQNVYATPDSAARCLVAAANHVRVSSIDDAKHWLRQAIAEREPAIRTIEEFNDTRRTFDEVAAVIARARKLALAAQLPVRVLPALPAPTSVPQVLPPSMPVVPVVARPVLARALQRADERRRRSMDIGWLDE